MENNDGNKEIKVKEEGKMPIIKILSEWNKFSHKLKMIFKNYVRFK